MPHSDYRVILAYEALADECAERAATTLTERFPPTRRGTSDPFAVDSVATVDQTISGYLRYVMLRTLAEMGARGDARASRLEMLWRAIMEERYRHAMVEVALARGEAPDLTAPSSWAKEYEAVDEAPWPASINECDQLATEEVFRISYYAGGEVDEALILSIVASLRDAVAAFAKKSSIANPHEWTESAI